MKTFHVFYHKKGLIFSSLVGDELVEAEDIAKAKTIANAHAKEAGWFVDNISEMRFFKLEKQIGKRVN